MTAMADLSGRPLEKLQGRGMYEHYRPLFNGALIANVGITPHVGNALIADGLVDLAAFGQPFIANPDLPDRLATGVALATPDRPRSGLKCRIGRLHRLSGSDNSLKSPAPQPGRTYPWRRKDNTHLFGDQFPRLTHRPTHMDEFTSVGIGRRA